MTIVTYFALEELIVGDNQLLFLCSFGNIFDVSEQLVLVEELKQQQTNRRRKFNSFALKPRGAAQVKA